MIDLSIETTDKPVIQKDLDLVLQQIDLLFDTQTEEVFGEAAYGTYFEQFLWEMNTSDQYIKNYVERAIKDNVNLLGFDVQTDVKIVQGTLNDIILIQVILSREGEEYEKTYKLK